MKTSYTLLIGILLISNFCFGQSDTIAYLNKYHSPPLTSRIISEEISNTPNAFDVVVRFYCNEAVKFTDFPKYDLALGNGADFLEITGFTNLELNRTFVDSTDVTFHFARVQASLPFYPKKFQINVNYQAENEDIARICKIPGRIYYTPYSTTEIWDEADFWNAKRIWHAEVTPEPERKYVAKDSIAVSNVSASDTLDPYYGNWNYLFYDGLAYAVPMKRTAPVDSTDEGTGNDSTGVGTKGNQSEEHYKADGCGATFKRFNYVVNGNIRSDMVNDLGIGSRVNLAGLRVELYENDGFDDQNRNDQFFGSATLNAAGNYTISFNRCQSAFEGDNIELFMIVYAEEPQFDCRAITTWGEITSRNLPGFVRRQVIGERIVGRSNHQSSTSLDGNIGDGSHRSITYLRNALEYTNAELDVSITGRITLMPFNIWGRSFYMPINIFSLVGGPSAIFNIGRPCINLARESVGDENTVYHEFGHHLMWKLQDEMWINPITGSFANHAWDEESNPHICWTEGWACGIQAILDRAFHRIDNESNRDGAPNFTNMETARAYNLNRGVLSEYYVATTIHDLFDGPTSAARYGYGVNNDIWNDNNSEGYRRFGLGLDNVEFSLQQICQPLINRIGFNQIPDFDDYYRDFTQNLGCQQRREVKRIFDGNRILHDVNDVSTGFSTDEIGFDRRYEFTAIGFNLFNNYYNTTVSEYFNVDVSTLDGNMNSYNIVAETPSHSKVLSDNLLIINGAHLFVNKNIPVRFLHWNSWQRPPVPSFLNLDICQNTRIEANNNGNIVVGDQAVNARARTTFQSGSTLILGGNTLTNTGHLLINDNSELVIEKGATLIVNPGATINLAGSGSKLIIKGNLIISDNAMFSFVGNGQVVFDYDQENNNITYGTNAGISFKGSDQSDVVAVINQKRLLVPDANSFACEAGRIEMNANSELAVGGALSLKNTRITSNNGLKNNHRGVHVYGSAFITIQGCTFENGFVGIFGELMFNHGAPLNVSESIFRNNTVGIHHISKGVNVTGSLFENNNVGVVSQAADFVCSHDNSVFNNNQRGIYIMAENTGGANVTSSTFTQNNEAFYGVGASISSFRCNQFLENPVGINAILSNTVNLSQSFNAGKNGFYNNSVSTQLSSAGDPILISGRNEFIGDGIDFQGSINTNTTQINAYRNFWETRSRRPVSGVDFNLTNQSNGIVSIFDNAPSTLGICTGIITYLDPPCRVTTFIESGDGNTLGINAACALPTPVECLTCDIIDLPGLPPVAINAAVIAGINQLQSAENLSDTAQALKMLGDITNATLGNPDPTDLALKRLAFDVMMRGVGLVAKTRADARVGARVGDVNAVIAATLESLDELAVSVTSSTDFIPQTHVAVSRAELLRLLDERISSIAVLSDQLNNTSASSQDYQYLQEWICVLEKENAVLNNTGVSYTSQDWLSCLSILEQEFQVSRPKESSAFPESISEYSISPNPVENNDLIVFIKSGDRTSIKYRILSAAGVVLSSGEMISGQNSININNLNPGLYNLHIDGNFVQPVQKFVKIQ